MSKTTKDMVNKMVREINKHYKDRMASPSFKKLDAHNLQLEESGLFGHWCGRWVEGPNGHMYIWIDKEIDSSFKWGIELHGYKSICKGKDRTIDDVVNSINEKCFNKINEKYNLEE